MVNGYQVLFWNDGYVLEIEVVIALHNIVNILNDIGLSIFKCCC